MSHGQAINARPDAPKQISHLERFTHQLGNSNDRLESLIDRLGALRGRLFSEPLVMPDARTTAGNVASGAMTRHGDALDRYEILLSRLDEMATRLDDLA